MSTIVLSLQYLHPFCYSFVSSISVLLRSHSVQLSSHSVSGVFIVLSCWRYTSQYFDYCYKWDYTVTWLQPTAVNKGHVLASDEQSDEHHWTVESYTFIGMKHICISHTFMYITKCILGWQHLQKNLPKYHFTYILLLLIAITMHGGPLSKMIWWYHNSTLLRQFRTQFTNMIIPS